MCQAKVRLNFQLSRRNSGPHSANYPDLEYDGPSGAAAGGSGGVAVFEIRVVTRILSGIPAAKPEIQTDPGRAYSGPRIICVTTGGGGMEDKRSQLRPAKLFNAFLNLLIS